MSFVDDLNKELGNSVEPPTSGEKVAATVANRVAAVPSASDQQTATIPAQNNPSTPPTQMNPVQNLSFRDRFQQAEASPQPIQSEVSVPSFKDRLQQLMTQKEDNLVESVKEAPAIPDHSDPAVLDKATQGVLDQAAAGVPVHSFTLASAMSKIKDEISGANLYKLLTTPVAQGYVELAKALPSSDLFFSKFSKGQTIQLPLQVKYGPMIGQALEGVEKVTGIPMTQMPDRFIFGAFMDQLLYNGAERTLFKLGSLMDSAVKNADKAPEAIQQVSNMVKTWHESGDPELLRFMEEEYGRQDTNLLNKLQGDVEEAMTLPQDKRPDALMAIREKTGQLHDIEKYDVEIHDMVKPLAKNIQESYLKEDLAKQLAARSEVKEGDIPVGDMLLRADDSGTMQPVKQVGPFEKAVAQQKFQPEEFATSEEVKGKIDSIEGDDILPAPGSADPTPLQKLGSKLSMGWKTIMHAAASPSYVVPELYDLHIGRTQLMTRTLEPYMQRLVPFVQQIPEDRQLVISAIVDGLDKHPNYAGAMESLSPMEAKAVQALRESWESLRDIGFKATKLPGLAPDRSILTYMTHMVQDMQNNKQILSPDLERLAKIGARYSKERTGAVNYELNAFKAFQGYGNWIAGKVADSVIQPKWEAVMKGMDPKTSKYGEWLWNNIHGIYNSAYPQLFREVLQGIKNNIYKTTLGWNMGASLANRTQFFLMGSARIGWGPAIEGFKLWQATKGTDEMAFSLQRILRESGIFNDMSEFLTNPSGKVPMSNRWFNSSEKFNKACTYLGSYQDNLNKLKMIQTSNPGAFPKTEQLLLSKGADLSGNPESQARKIAFKDTMQTQIDMGKAGQAAYQSDPGLSMLGIFTNFPVRAAEYVAKTGAGAVADIAKYGVGALNRNHVREALRLTVNAAIGYAIAAASGVDAKRMFSSDVITPGISPTMKMMYRALQTLNAQGTPGVDRYDVTGKGLRIFAQDMTMLTGIPGAMQVWKISSFLKTVHDNVDNHTGLWNVYDDTTGVLKYKINPIAAIAGLAVPTSSRQGYQDAMNLYTQEHEQRKNALQQVEKAIYEHRDAKAQEISQQFNLRPPSPRKLNEYRNMTFEERLAAQQQRHHGR